MVEIKREEVAEVVETSIVEVVETSIVEAVETIIVEAVVPEAAVVVMELEAEVVMVAAAVMEAEAVMGVDIVITKTRQIILARIDLAVSTIKSPEPKTTSNLHHSQHSNLTPMKSVDLTVKIGETKQKGVEFKGDGIKAILIIKVEATVVEEGEITENYLSENVCFLFFLPVA